MNRDSERFVEVYSQGKLNVKKVFVDRETEVNYIEVLTGYASSFMPLIDKDGKPLVTDVNDLDRYNYD